MNFVNGEAHRERCTSRSRSGRFDDQTVVDRQDDGAMLTIGVFVNHAGIGAEIVSSAKHDTGRDMTFPFEHEHFFHAAVAMNR